MDPTRASRTLSGKAPLGDELVIIDDATIERPFGWVFFYQSKRYLESGEFEFCLAGNAPLIVDRRTGEVHVTGTARPIETYIAAYESSEHPRA